MPAVLIGILRTLIGSLIARMLLGAGLAIFTYTWIQGQISDAQSAVGSLLGSLPSDIVGLIGLAKIPQALSVVMSAIGVAAFIKASKIFIGKASS